MSQVCPPQTATVMFFVADQQKLKPDVLCTKQHAAEMQAAYGCIIVKSPYCLHKVGYDAHCSRHVQKARGSFCVHSDAEQKTNATFAPVKTAHAQHHCPAKPKPNFCTQNKAHARPGMSSEAMRS